MMNLLSILGKNFKLFTRSKLSASAIILAPLLIVFLVGTAFNSSSYQGIIVGTYSENYGDLSESILKSFEEQSLLVNRLDSQEDCINSVKDGRVQICVIFPTDLSVEGNSEEVVFYADYSRSNLAYALINQVESEISVKASELGVAMVNDLIGALESAKSSLTEQKSDVSVASSKLGSIDSKANSASVDGAISKLDSVKTSVSGLNDSSSKLTKIKNDIDSVISDLNSVKSVTDGIKSDGSEASSRLTNVNSKIDALISVLNSVKVSDAEKVAMPIKTKVESVNTKANNLNYLFPTLIALMILFGSIILASSFILKEKKTKAYFRNFITPTSDVTFFVGAYLTCLIILIVQLIILFAGAIWLGVDVVPYLGSIALIVLVSSSLFIFFGMLIGYSFKSEEAGILAAISVAAVAMFFSNTILPVETISANFQKVAEYNPLVLTDSILKKIILFGSDFVSVLPEFYFLLGWFGLLGILAFVAREITRRAY